MFLLSLAYCWNNFNHVLQGSILDSILEAEGTVRRHVIYVGDGGGDFCPSLRLLDGDHVLARNRYSHSFDVFTKLVESKHKVSGPGMNNFFTMCPFLVRYQTCD